MSARLTAILDFVGSRFQAGISRANMAVQRFGKAIRGLATTSRFLMTGGGLMLGLMAISRHIEKIRDMAAKGEFIGVDEQNLRNLEKAKELVADLKDSMLDAAVEKAGSWWNKLFGKKENPDAPSRTESASNASRNKEMHEIMWQIREMEASRTATLEDDLEIIDALKAQADEEARIAKTQLDRVKAQKKSLELAIRYEQIVKKIEEGQQGDSPAYAQAKLEEAATLREAALDPSKRRDIFRDIKKQDRDDRRFNRLLASANEKLASPFKMSSKLTRAEKLALASREAENLGKQALPHIAEYTRDIRDIIKDALVIQK